MTTDTLLNGNVSSDRNKTLDLRQNINSSEEVTPDIYIEQYSLGLKVVFGILGVLLLTISIVANAALRRTRKVPSTTKFLATGLLCADCTFIIVSTARKMMVNQFYQNLTIYVGAVSLGSAYLTVCMMAIDRFFIFYRPMVYMRICTPRFIRRVCVIVWSTDAVIHLSLRYPVCYLRYRSMEVFYQAAFCNHLVTPYYSILLVFVLVSSTLCYIRIFQIVRKKMCKRDGIRKTEISAVLKTLGTLKTTSVVFANLILILLTLFAYSVFIAIDRFKLAPNGTVLRLPLDLVSTTNCLLDPFLYVLWFKECQMELLKMFGFLGVGIRRKVEKMRLEIFNIVTYDRCGVTAVDHTRISMSTMNTNCGVIRVESVSEL